ncbi:MAG: gamma-glutamyl-gamma-aminobutyrate hydrolase family protein [Nitrospirae bacterium]|nr:gamma-glutamyl-gamma-aminobutyrate hydrolase family protein [Nitrospirota bacterium]MBI3351063.1 gamma-glutamyl-gamma-aminobutyrate hydrolase family protein [Nitrospirota bacterium]
MKKKSHARPVIGITPDFNGNRNEFGGKEPTYFLRTRYADAIWDLGGIPVLLPFSEKKKATELIFSKIDGLLLTGSGPDLPPSLYGEKQKFRFPLIQPLRFQFEMGLCRLALKHHKPLLGICGGAQVFNVALKGSLIQDIPSQIQTSLVHRQKKPAVKKTHQVNISRDSLLFRILGQTLITVNSSHHQAIKKPGRSLKINALSPDGIVEGIEHVSHPFAIGVQWHPEWLYKTDISSKKIFTAFIQAAKASKN